MTDDCVRSFVLIFYVLYDQFIIITSLCLIHHNTPIKSNRPRIQGPTQYKRSKEAFLLFLVLSVLLLDQAKPRNGLSLPPFPGPHNSFCPSFSPAASLFLSLDHLWHLCNFKAAFLPTSPATTRVSDGFLQLLKSPLCTPSPARYSI